MSGRFISETKANEFTKEWRYHGPEAVTLYGLRDPIDKTIRYIGVTRNMSARLAGHMKRPTELVGRWIGNLTHGMNPRIVHLGTASPRGWEYVERETIRRIQHAGYDLLNVHEGGRGVRNNGKLFGAPGPWRNVETGNGERKPTRKERNSQRFEANQRAIADARDRSRSNTRRNGQIEPSDPVDYFATDLEGMNRAVRAIVREREGQPIRPAIVPVFFDLQRQRKKKAKKQKRGTLSAFGIYRQTPGDPRWKKT